MRVMEEELRDYRRAQDEALTKRKLLEQTLKDLEYELEAKSHLKDDRSRLMKQMEVCGPARGVPTLCPPLGKYWVSVPFIFRACKRSLLDLGEKLIDRSVGL